MLEGTTLGFSIGKPDVVVLGIDEGIILGCTDSEIFGFSFEVSDGIELELHKKP